MVYNVGTRIFVPCVYCLLTSKSEYLYLTAFHEIIFLMKYSWMPQIITTDFEISLIAAIRHEFCACRLFGCYFYLKKAIERKLKKYKISSRNVQTILSKIELLTVLPINEINLGIEYIKTRTAYQPELSTFWNVFSNTWLRRFNPTLWNLSNLSDINMT
ncbi:hypothetical protein HZS_1988, partial [Henneguya salminicola]